MTNLVLLNGERDKRKKGDRKRLIAGLQELLAKAESGELKALCYASIDSDNEGVCLGILRGGEIGLHELVGLSQMLNDSLLKAAHD